MPFDPNALVDQVVSIIKSALAPVLADVTVLKNQFATVEMLRERVAVVETKADRPVPVPEIPEIPDMPDLTPLLADLDTLKAQMAIVDGLRERVAVVETKADRPVPTVELPKIPDLTPLLERLAGAEARLQVIGDVRDRLVAVETKANQPQPEPVQPLPPPDLTPILERLAATEARIPVIGDVRERLVAVEAKATQPIFSMPPEAGIDDLKDRIKTLEMRSEGPSVAEMGLVELRKAISDLQAELKFEVRENSSLRERVAVLESRPLQPGPKGDPGAPGKDGKDGEQGKPGLEWTGDFQEGKSYEKGQLARFGGSTWHCNETTMIKPGDGKAWTLMVKRGSNGKDGRDAVSVPVVNLVGAK